MKEKFGISGSTIKMIAIISMFIDHFGAAVVGRIISCYSATNYGTVPDGIVGLFSLDTWFTIYQVIRSIGRLGFPIFCFLLVEGFFHTHDAKKYALRLLAFCFISEIPFDLAFNGSVLEFGYQNVYFTLFLGLLTMIGLDVILKKKNWHPIIRGILSILTAIAGMLAAELLATDYAAIGVFCIMMLYLTHSQKPLQLTVGCIEFLWEIPAPLAFLPIAFYNGKRGWKMKYFFYIFYPAHLLLLVLLCYALGLMQYSAM